MGFRMRAVALTALVLLLAGCVPNEPAVTARLPAADPIFASDEEALAAAVEAYERYLELSDSVAMEGGNDVDRLAPAVHDDQLEKERAVFAEFQLSGQHRSGESIVTRSRLQQHGLDAEGHAQVIAYFCTDFSATRFLDASGQDVTPFDRDTAVTMEATFVGTEPGAKSIVVRSLDKWAGSSIC